MKRRFSLFTYPVMDMKAAEAALNRKAAAGWRLERLWLGMLASFVPAEAPVCYCLDWYDPGREDGADYRTLLADAGWKFHSQARYWNIYEAPAGAAPIQTDSSLEYQRFRNKALRRMALGAVMPAAAVLLLLLTAFLALRPGNSSALDWRFFPEWLAGSYIAATLLALAPLILPVGLLWLGRMALRLGQWRRAARTGEPFPVPGRGNALAASVLSLAAGLLYIPMALACVVDWVDGRLSKGVLVGIVVGALLVLTRKEGEEHRRQRKHSAVMLVVAAALLAGGWLCPPGTLAPFGAAAPAVERPLLPGRTEVEETETRATFLAAHEGWTEWGVLVEGVSVGGLYGDAWTLPQPWLADWVTEQYRRDLAAEGGSALPGYEGVWLAREPVEHEAFPEGSTRDFWLIRRGETVLWIETNLGPLDEAWLNGILTQLEEGGAA